MIFLHFVGKKVKILTKIYNEKEYKKSISKRITSIRSFIAATSNVGF